MQAQRETADAECDTTVNTQGDASRRETEDREWASAIKAYHYHLQHAVQECTTNTNDTSSSSSSMTDLARWRAVLQRDAERARQRDYAAAMYKLATCFWDRPTEEGDTDNVEEKNNDDSNMSARRPRAEEQPSRKRIVKRKATLSYSSSRRCSDRVQLCLDSIQEYFLGESTSVLTNNSENNNMSRSVEHAGCVYARLPLIFSRALKPLRRAFYEMHHRMITPTELEQLLFHSWLNQSSDSAKEVTQCTEWPFLKLGTARDLPCANDAWAVAAMYARALSSSSSAQFSTESNTLALPPLCALDVGSCYGPFFHRRLSHKAFNDTPIHVTAIDLQPYRPSQCQTGTDNAESNTLLFSSSSLHREESDARADRRVWKGDWLTLSFYDRKGATLSSSTHADDATLGKDVNSVSTYFAEDGKLCIQRGSTSSSEEEEEDVVCGVASAAYDVVIFCLLLSFLPTPRLRYLACLHAYLALKPQGLLVILSTRTQGSRKRDWIEDWVNGLQEVGFCRVHKQLCEKLVLLTFAKTSIVATTINKSSEAECGAITTTTPLYDLDSVEGRAAWLAMKMQSSTAATSLYITADDAH